MMIGIIANIFTKLLYNFRDYFHLTLLYFEDIIILFFLHSIYYTSS